jgi:hypothetical protein
MIWDLTEAKLYIGNKKTCECKQWERPGAYGKGCLGELQGRTC